MKKDNISLSKSRLCSLTLVSWRLLQSIIRIEPKNFEEFRNLIYRPKEGREEFGYYASDPIPIYSLMKQRRITSIIDLGCGLGITMYNLQILSEDNFIVAGIENEKMLQDCCLCHSNLGDITEIKREDIEKYEAIYFWEPLMDEKKSVKFANALAEAMSPKQIVIYKCDGRMGGDIMKTGKFKKLRSKSYLQVFKLKTNGSIKNS